MPFIESSVVKPTGQLFKPTGQLFKPTGQLSIRGSCSRLAVSARHCELEDSLGPSAPQATLDSSNSSPCAWRGCRWSQWLASTFHFTLHVYRGWNRTLLGWGGGAGTPSHLKCRSQKYYAQLRQASFDAIAQSFYPHAVHCLVPFQPGGALARGDFPPPCMKWINSNYLAFAYWLQDPPSRHPEQL